MKPTLSSRLTSIADSPDLSFPEIEVTKLNEYAEDAGIRLGDHCSVMDCYSWRGIEHPVARGPRGRCRMRAGEYRWITEGYP